MAYVPGQNYYGQTKIMPPGGNRRILDSDEFNAYYYSMTSNEYALPVKAAIGVVLLADLKRLYKSEYFYNKVPEVEKWAEYYKSLTGIDKNIADAEIAAFEQYLVESYPVYPIFTPGTPSQFDAFKSMMENKRHSLQWNLALERAEAQREQYIQNDLTMQEKAYRISKLKGELTASGTQSRFQNFIKENLIDYLAGSFFKSPLAQRMNDFKSEKEFYARHKVMKLVTDGVITPLDSLALYDGYLTIIDASNNEEEFQVLEKKLNLSIRHPIARFF